MSYEHADGPVTDQAAQIAQMESTENILKKFSFLEPLQCEYLCHPGIQIIDDELLARRVGEKNTSRILIYVTTDRGYTFPFGEVGDQGGRFFNGHRGENVSQCIRRKKLQLSQSPWVKVHIGFIVTVHPTTTRSVGWFGGQEMYHSYFLHKFPGKHNMTTWENERRNAARLEVAKDLVVA